MSRRESLCIGGVELHMNRDFWLPDSLYHCPPGKVRQQSSTPSGKANHSQPPESASEDPKRLLVGLQTLHVADLQGTFLANSSSLHIFTAGQTFAWITAHFHVFVRMHASYMRPQVRKHILSSLPTNHSSILTTELAFLTRFPSLVAPQGPHQHTTAKTITMTTAVKIQVWR
ncbi:hypothetical protein ILYODFUR_033282 [Ilyodon furcidens]|uniref:Uncharacterized protein n=1 Tax=Ilyodon furcidens TaxID=33524 RepID=A0ABV0TD65_9TELE